MIENKKIQNRLLITIIIQCIIEVGLCLIDNESIWIDVLSNINIGIIGSSIVSYVISIITYNYKKEETLQRHTAGHLFQAF